MTRPQPQDVEALLAMWWDWFADVDLAIVPGRSILDWITHAPGLAGLVLAHEGQVVGYLRYVQDRPAEVKLFLARDRDSAVRLLQHLEAKIGGTEGAAIHLPLHPDSRAVQTLLGLPYEAVLVPWEAAMICILDADNGPLRDYCRQVGSGRRNPGQIIYPPCFEFAAECDQ